MLVHWNSHFHAANMENEVYSERSMSMRSLCSIFFFCCLIWSVHFFQPQRHSSTNIHTNRKRPELRRLPSLSHQLGWNRSQESSGLVFSFEIRFSGWERKQPGGMYCVRTVGAASALRARFLRSYVPLRRDRVKTCALTIHTSRRTLSQSDKYEFTSIGPDF